MSRLRFRLALAIPLLVALAACSGGDSSTGPLPVAIASVSFGTDLLMMEAGDTTATPAPVARAADGSVVTGTVGRPLLWAWRSSDAAVLTVHPTTGRLVAVGVGAATLTATFEGREGSVVVAVSTPTVRTIALTPSVPNLGVGDTTTVAAAPLTKRGVVLERPITWATTNAGVLTVDAEGRVTAVGTGSASVTATVDGVSQSVAMIVSPNGLPFAFVYEGDVPERIKVAMRAAAQRWQRVVLDAGAPVTLPKQNGACEALWGGQASRTFRGVAVVVSMFDHDGQALADAAGCVMRPDGGLTAGGMVRFDIGSVDWRTDAELASVAAHELGHVLGIGQLWNDPASLGWQYVRRERDATGPWRIVDYYFTGPGAMSALAAIWGEHFARLGVPLQQPDGGHWTASVGDEVMTPTAGPRGLGKLTAVTVQALADMGYTVNVAAAETYQVAAAGSVAARAAVTAPVIDGGSRTFW